MVISIALGDQANDSQSQGQTVSPPCRHVSGPENKVGSRHQVRHGHQIRQENSHDQVRGMSLEDFCKI